MIPQNSGKVSVGHPIDVASGILFHEFEDYELTGRVPLIFSRRYSSGIENQSEGIFGGGWSSPFEMRILRDMEGYRMIAEDGETEIEFDDPDDLVESGEIIRNFGAFHEICQQGNNFVVTRWDPDSQDIVRYVFPKGKEGEWWYLASRENVEGQGIDIDRDITGRIIGLSQRLEGRGYRIVYNQDGRVTTVYVPANPGKPFDHPIKLKKPILQYNYNNNGQLCEVINPLGHRSSYEYNESRRMVREISMGGMEFKFRYNKDGQCVESTGIDNFGYTKLEINKAAKLTEVTNSLGHTTVYEWNDNGQVEREISPIGNISAKDYDEYGRIAAETNPNGATTKYEYDEYGNRIEITNPDGVTYNFQYNHSHLVSRLINPLGAEWNFDYDSQNRLIAITYPTGFKWHFHWNKIGNLVKAENNIGGIWRYLYDQFGQISQITNWLGVSIKVEFDGNGLPTKIMDSSRGETRYRRDALGQIVRINYPDGIEISNTYDSGGNLVKTINSEVGSTIYIYGHCGRMLEIQSSDGRRSIQYVWGTEPDHLQAIMHGKGKLHSFEYNEEGYLISETFPGGKTVSYVRNANGEVIKCINGSNEATLYERDAVGRILTTTFFDGSQATFKYNAIGSLVCAMNSDATVKLERNIAGFRTKENCNGYEIESQYDKAGNRTLRKSSLGSESSYLYDSGGNLIQIGLSDTSIIQFEHDMLGREVHRHFPGMVLSKSYDPMDRIIEQLLATDDAIRGSSDNFPSSPIIHRRYKYDNLGNLNEMWDKDWGDTSFRYDRADHLIERLQASGLREKFSYDADNNVISVIKTFTISSAIDHVSGECSSEPVILDRHIGIDNQVIQDGDTIFEYNVEGRLIRKTQDHSTKHPQIWKYKWNPMGLLSEVNTPSNQQWRYSYDALGRRIRKQGPNQDILYIWDGNAIIHEINVFPNADFTTWTFWPDDFRPFAKQENGKTYFAINDHLGTPQELVDEKGRIAWSVRLSTWGKVESLNSFLTDCHIRFQGQWFDPESGLHYNNFRYYDPDLGSFISMDPIPLIGGLNGYQYVPNPVNWIDPFGLIATYYPLDEYRRPTGAFAEITKSDLGTGTKAKGEPPGWKSGKKPHYQNRSHLIANSLGGSGSDPKNIVALTDGSNHPGMSRLESKIRNHVKNNPNKDVLMEVRVNYHKDKKTPKSIHIYAIDEDGKVIVDDTVENGKLQKHKC